MKRTLKEEINLIKKRMNLIVEEKNHKHEYGCVMLYFSFPEMKLFHEKINEDDIYIDPEDDSYGLEDETHVTLLYGLHPEVKFAQIKESMQNITFQDCVLRNISIFENEKYDVLKFDVNYLYRGGSFLHKANNELKKFPYTSDYPDYHPHVTIGYLKKGMGEKYVNKFKNSEYKVTPQYGVYSEADGTKTKFEIKLQKH